MNTFFKYLFPTFFLSLALLWYDYLWLPRIHLHYWTQTIPIAAALFFLANVLKKSPVVWIIRTPMAILFIASILLQVLVWVNLVPLPLY